MKLPGKTSSVLDDPFDITIRSEQQKEIDRRKHEWKVEVIKVDKTTRGDQWMINRDHRFFEVA